MEEKENSRRIDLFILISVIVHILLLLIISPFLAIEHQIPSDPMEIELFEREPKITKQIVDIPELAPREIPDEAKYLSKHYQKVERETQAVTRGAPQQPKQTQLETREPTYQDIEKEQEEESDKESEKEPASQESLKTKLDEKFEDKVAAWHDNNYLPDIPKDDRTYINAEAFAHTGYFVEIKRKVSLTWNPRSALISYFNQGISIERGVLSVTLGVTVNPDGTIYHVAILRPSGISAYDKECIRSIRDSSPFTSPPKELLSPDNKLRFEFGFFVYGS